MERKKGARRTGGKRGIKDGGELQTSEF